jgi:triacylglycerol lipase
LAHGLLGFKTLLGVLDYWYEIPSALTSSGATVYVTQVTAVQSSEVRGEQLLSQIQTILAATGAKKVNLIGHSQGGIDARYVAAVRPDLVASVTTVATPHKGAALADYLGSLPPSEQQLDAALFNAIGQLIDSAAGGSPSVQDAWGAMQSLSTAGATAFNTSYPQGVPTTACGSGAPSGNGILFYSWGGTGIATNALDISDLVLDLTSKVYNGPNDGLVGQCSSHFGTVIRDNYNMNHLDEVNQVAGLVSPFETSPLTLFRAQANRLKGAGL